MVEQIGIGLFSVTAIFFANCTADRWRRWASVFGLASQPFWFVATYQAQQWGIFALSFIYAALWARGFYSFWIKSKG